MKDYNMNNAVNPTWMNNKDTVSWMLTLLKCGRSVEWGRRWGMEATFNSQMAWQPLYEEKKKKRELLKLIWINPNYANPLKAHEWFAADAAELTGWILE